MAQDIPTERTKPRSLSLLLPMLFNDSVYPQIHFCCVFEKVFFSATGRLEFRNKVQPCQMSVNVNANTNSKKRSQNKASSFSKHSLISSTKWLLSGSAFRHKQLVASGSSRRHQLAEIKAPVEVLRRPAPEEERHVMDGRSAELSTWQKSATSINSI